MKFCQGLHKSDRLYDKITDIEIKSWATAQEIVKKFAQSQVLEAYLVKVHPKHKAIY